MAKIKSEISRSNIKVPILTQLWGMTAGRCEFCNRSLLKDLTLGEDGNYGQVAHIHAVSLNGPRHVPDMSKEEINNVANLMLLCYDHHTMIDKNPDRFSDDSLYKLKCEAEARIDCLTSISDMRKCTIISYFGNIDGNPVIHDSELFRRAVIKAGLYPGTNKGIDLSEQEVGGYVPQKDFFVSKSQNLEKRFRLMFGDIVKQGETVAVFALASQPLLIKLGSLLNDKYDAIPFQCHRDGEKWTWRNTGDDVEFIIQLPSDFSGETCALVIDLSARIDDSRISEVCGDIPIVHLTIANPNRTFVTHQAIVTNFVCKFREVVELIKNESHCKRILLFPAMPIALAVRLGMDYMHKTDPPMVIYEQGEPGMPFFETITIGD